MKDGQFVCTDQDAIVLFKEVAVDAELKGIVPVCRVVYMRDGFEGALAPVVELIRFAI